MSGIVLDVAPVVRDVLHRVEELLSAGDEIAAVFSHGGRALRTRLQALYGLKLDDPAQAIVLQVVLQHALACELTVPGTFDDCMQLIVAGNPFARSGCSPERSLVPTSSIVRELIEHHLSFNDVNMVLDALELSGFNGQIVVEKTSSRQHIELVDGCSFKLSSAIAGPRRMVLDDCRVVCMDGHIETVAQGHRLLEQVFDSKQPCALFVRDLSEEVKQTIKVNFDRGSMRLIPFIVTFDLEGANTLVDVAISAGGDVVSKDKGCFVSSIDLSDHPVVERVEINDGAVVIRSRAARPAVRVHLARLIEKASALPSDQSRFLDHRIRSMSAGVVRLRISDGLDFALRAQRIDFALRVVKSALSFGVVLNNDGRPELVHAGFAASMHAERCLNSLAGIASIVT